jgi:PadR family transcriptional regulator
LGGKLYLGELEHVVMATVLALGDDAYGARIMEHILDKTGRRLKSGSLYVTLDRLESKGYLESSVGDPEPGRGGRPKRFVTLTSAGMSALRAARQAMMSVWAGLEALLDEVP